MLAEAPLVEWTIRSGETVTGAGISKLVADLGWQTDGYFGLCQNDMYGTTKTAYGVWQQRVPYRLAAASRSTC